MPRIAQPLPEWLHGQTFHLETGLDEGMPRGRLRGVDLSAPSRGVRRPASLDFDFEARVAAVTPVLPLTGAYSHVTAARLFGLPVTRGQEKIQDVEVIDVPGAPQVRRRGVIGHRGRHWRRVIHWEGLPVVAPLDLWCDFGELVQRDGLTLDDFVVLGDAVINLVVRQPELAGLTWLHEPRTTAEFQECAGVVIGELRAVVDERVRPRGKRHLEAALPLLRYGVKSPMESRTRMVFYWGGLPEPEINASVHNELGEWLGEGDLVWDGRVVVEYQGEHHAGRKRRSSDSQRRELMGDAKVKVFEAFAEDIYQAPRRDALIRRVAAAVGVEPSPRPYPVLHRVRPRRTRKQLVESADPAGMHPV